MYSIISNLSALFSWTDYHLRDPYFNDINKYKGGTSVGTEFVGKWFRTEIHYAQQKYASMHRRFNQVHLSDLLTDNWFRILLFNGIQRVITIQQTFPLLRSRFQLPSQISATFTAVTSGGFFKGWLGGVSLPFVQLAAVTYPSLYLANEGDRKNKFYKFAGYYTLFDILTYPLDKIKTIAFSDLSHSNITVAVRNAMTTPFSGLLHKLAFNLPVFGTIYTTVNDSSTAQKALSWGLLAFLYPLNTFKAQLQVSGTQLCLQNGLGTGVYRGLLPFLALNYFVQYNLYNLYNDSLQEAPLQELTDKVSSLRQPRNW